MPYNPRLLSMQIQLVKLMQNVVVVIDLTFSSQNEKLIFNKGLFNVNFEPGIVSKIKFQPTKLIINVISRNIPI